MARLPLKLILRFAQNIQLSVAWDIRCPMTGRLSSPVIDYLFHTGNSFQEIADQVPLPSIHYRYLWPFFIWSCPYTHLPEEQSMHFPCCSSINPNTAKHLCQHSIFIPYLRD